MSAAQSKWFSDLTAEAAPAEAARAVLMARCATVQEQLDRLGGRPDDDVGPVHQTRVATRRLSAALSVFQPWLDSACERRLRKTAGRIRRAAGAVRDLDVGLDLLRERLELAAWMPPTLTGQIVECVEERRGEAKQALLRELPRLASRFERAARQAAHELRAGRLDLCGQPASLGAVAGAVLGETRERLAAAGAGDLSDADSVHQLRIAAKRLRYAMEIFVGCYSKRFREDLYARVEALQGELGELNDLRYLYRGLADLRPSLAAHRGRDERDEIKALADRFSATVAHEWMDRQQAFADRWAREGAVLIGRFRELLEREAVASPPAGNDGRAAAEHPPGAAEMAGLTSGGSAPA